jgi:hypothetical protein
MINWFAQQIKMSKCVHEFESREVKIFAPGAAEGSRVVSMHVVYTCKLCVFTKRVEIF